MTNDVVAAPREGVAYNTMVVALCGGFGGIVATLADMMSKDGLSTVGNMSRRISDQLSIPFTPVEAVFVVFVLACGICLLNECNTPQRAFMTGLGILSFIITATPQQPLPQHPAPPKGTERAAESGPRGFASGHLVGVAFAADVKSGEVASPEPILVKFRLVSDRPTREVRQVTLTVWEAADRSNAGRQIFPRLPDKTTPTINVREVSMPLSPGRYVARIEIHGFAIKQQELEVKPPVGAAGTAPLTVEVELKSSGVPIFIQRMTLD